MNFFTTVGLCVVLYMLIYVIALCLFDCDLQLAFAELFGKQLDKLRGKIIWITDALNPVGEEMVYKIARNDGKLIISGRKKEELYEMKKKCLLINKDLSDDDILVLPLEVTKVETHQECFDQIIEHFNTLDIIVNNVGLSQRAKWEYTESKVDRQIFELNVFSVANLTRIAVRFFNKKGKGRLAVMSSIAGIVGVPFTGSFSGTKHALHGLYESLRIEKLGKNIHLTILCPGPVLGRTKRFTENSCKKSNKTEQTGRRMTPERCAHLSLIAIVNKLDEVWMALFPILPLVYFMKYYPNVSKIIIKYLGGRAKMELNSKDN